MTEEERLMQANIEALMDGEIVSIPCEINESASCTFDFVNASGESGKMTLENHKKVD